MLDGVLRVCDAAQIECVCKVCVVCVVCVYLCLCLVRVQGVIDVYASSFCHVISIIFLLFRCSRLGKDRNQSRSVTTGIAVK